MSTYSFVSALRKSARPLRAATVLPLLSALLIALQFLLPSLAFASSHTSRISHANGFQFGVSQALDRASVSVVRLVVAYTAPAGCVLPTTNVTGLGVLVGSWPVAPGSKDIVNWLLTDGTLVNPNGLTCAPGKAEPLSTLQIYANSAYTNQPAGTTLKALRCQPSQSVQPTSSVCTDGTNPAMIQCQSSPACANGVVLVPFHTSLPQPFVDLANTDQTASTHGIELTGSLSGSPTVGQAAQFLTPALASATDSKTEVGMPIVTEDGHLFDMHSKAIDTAQSIQNFVNNVLQPLIGNNTNALHDAWNKGITDYYANNASAAQTDMQKAQSFNSQFQAPTTFLTLPVFQSLNRTSTPTNSGIGTTNPPTKSTKNPTNTTSGSSNANVDILGVPIPRVWLVVGGIIFLVVLLLLLSLLFIRQQGRRRERARELARFEEERRTASQKAAADAAVIAEQEKREWQKVRPAPTRQLQYPQQPPMMVQQLSPVQNNGSMPPLPVPEAPAQPPPVPSAPPDGLVPSAALSDLPTLPIPPNLSATPSIDTETTMPFKVEQRAGRNVGLAVGTRSDPGIKRKHKPNEDSLFAAQGERTHDSQTQQFGLFVVADGMGGHSNGQDASRLAIQTIVNRLLPRLSSDEVFSEEALVNLLVDGVQQANAAVYQHNMELRADMGTTMTAALVVADTAYVANVGDSRTYLYRPPEGLRKITNDHSVVASLVEAGIIRPDDIYTHPKRNQIYRSLGEKPVIDIDHFIVRLKPGDKLLLCSDGLWDMVRDPLIQQVMSQVPDPSQTGNALIKAALDGGGEDNVSVIVVSVTEATKRTGITGIQLLDKPDTVQMPPM